MHGASRLTAEDVVDLGAEAIATQLERVRVAPRRVVGFDDCPFGAITMVPRSDGRAYDSEPVVNVNQCTSCGICAGSCPTSTPFRRSGPLEPGIELPHRSIANLRDELVSGTEKARVIVFACDTSDAGEFEQGGVRVIRLPCVGMLPPSFVDFALARHHAEGVMIAGCAECDCQHRLGDQFSRAAADDAAGGREPAPGRLCVFFARAVEHGRDAEVGEIRIAVFVEEDVGRLDVSMDDALELTPLVALAVGRVEGLGDVGDDIGGVMSGDRLLALPGAIRIRPRSTGSAAQAGS